MSRREHIRQQQLLREAEGYLDLATVFSDRWDLDAEIRNSLAARALAQLQVVREIGGPSFNAYYLEGEALRTMQRWADAVKPLEAARAEDASSIHIHLALAWCYKRMGKLDLAIESLEEALTVDPTEAILYYNLACYWSLAGNARLAVTYLTEAFDLDSDYRDLVADEEDFNAIRNHPAFISLTTVIV